MSTIRSQLRDKVSLIDQEEQKKKTLFIDKSAIQFGTTNQYGPTENDDKIAYRVIETQSICGICYIKFDIFGNASYTCHVCKGLICKGCSEKKIGEQTTCDICFMKNTLADQTSRRQVVLENLSESITRVIEDRSKLLAEYQRSERQFSQMRQDTVIGLSDDQKVQQKRENMKKLQEQSQRYQDYLEEIEEKEFELQQELRNLKAQLQDLKGQSENLNKELYHKQKVVQDRIQQIEDLELQVVVVRKRVETMKLAKQSMNPSNTRPLNVSGGGDQKMRDSADSNNTNNAQNQDNNNGEGPAQDDPQNQDYETQVLTKSVIVASQTYEQNDLIRQRSVQRSSSFIQQQNQKMQKEGSCNSCNVQACNIF